MAKPKIEKLTYIGGGSSYTPEFIDGFIQHEQEIELGEFALQDIDERRLTTVGGMVERMLRYKELDTKVSLHLQREPAIEGAEFVVSAIRVGGMDARIRDEKIPLKYDVIGQETTGPGGTLKAWRTIPVALDIAKDMAKYAPGAWFLNFTNPSGIITEAILNHSDVVAVGLCNNPITTQYGIAALLGVEPEEIFLEWVGLNHINWIQRVFSQGVDVTQDLIAQVADAPDSTPMSLFAPELVRALGVLPTWYQQYYYYHDKKVKEAQEAEKSRGEIVKEVEAALMQKYEDKNEFVKPPELSMRGGALYSEAALQLILSLTFDRR
ncbi:MAG: hypothetical protein KAH97_09095, partial [Anaerolineales bacterium]|nr:hypothetical protein [Anaerolineales bacterium]